MQSSNCNFDISLLLSVMNEAGEIRLPVQGKSMLPFLKENRDSVVLRPANNVSVGDIVIYRRGSGYYLHRVIKIRNGTFTIMGDNELTPDKGIKKDSIVAVVEKCFINGNVVSKDNSLWKFYSKIYINPVLRRFALKAHKIRKTVVK